MRLTFVLVGVLLACAAYEAALALEWISSATADAGPALSDWTLAAALVTMVVAIGACVAATLRRRPGAVALVAPAAAAFVVARYYTFDPYYFPALRRASDGGLFSVGWIYGIVIAAVVAAALVRFDRCAANALAMLVLLVCLVTSVAMYAGH